ncbi:MAG: hypothetical protein WC750_05940 [Patescibacteria group bacterium]|jgi:hypothetical protein
MSQETIELYDLILVHSTSRAYLVRSEDGSECWIPKSQVKDIELGKDVVGDDGNILKEINSLTIPEWLAENHGLT